VTYRPVPPEAVTNPFLGHTNDWLLPGYGAAPHCFPPADLPQGDESPKPAHFYHLYAGELGGNLWQRVAGEHFEALASAGFDGSVHVGIVAKPQALPAVRSWLDMAWPGWHLANHNTYGYEQVTLFALHDHVQRLDRRTPVLYAHTKGVYRTSEHQDLWRRCMQDTCVTRWRDCVAKLDEDYDVCGAHYLIPDGRAVGVPMLAGNYWWATAGYIAGLPAVRTRDRYDAEAWIGLDNPRVYDFVPYGWPQHPHELC
jgi:hypothetical protein